MSLDHELLPWACLRAADTSDSEAEPTEIAGFFPYEVAGRWRGRPETIARRAFAVDDGFRLLRQHDEGSPLARLDGALQLEHSDDGLTWSVPLDALPDTSWTRDSIEGLRGGVLTGCSPGFSTRPGDLRVTPGGTRVLRAQLHEVSIVGQPAYRQSAVALRSDGRPRRLLLGA